MSMLTLGQTESKSRPRSWSSTVVELAAIVGLVLALVAVAGLTARPVRVTVDGMADTVRTHRRSLDKLLLDLKLSAEDIAEAGAIAPRPLPDDVVVDRPRRLRILAHGRDLRVASDGVTPAAVLSEAGVIYDAADRVLVEGKLIGIADPLPTEALMVEEQRYDRGYAWDNLARTDLQMRLYRSTPVVVADAGLAFDLRTTAQTVGEALRDAKITLYLGDRVQPSLGSAITPGMRISVQRSTPLGLHVDGRTVKTRSRAAYVADVLADMKVGLSGLDHVSPPPETALYDNINIEVTRVHEDIEVEEEIAPFETIFEPDPNLPIDAQRVKTPGAEGITRTRHRLRYENDAEVDRVFEDRWVAQEPAQRTIAYGTGIEPKTATTDGGQQITYWRKVRMFASSYSAGTAGLAPDHPWYGRTYSGEPMRGGIVAVDPSIIPLRSQVYVPGYGMGDALDTGSAIRARRIDLGYDDSDLELWSQWVDVYLLWPPPADYQITWVMPNWPRLPE